MLEIILVVVLSKKIAAMVREKGRSVGGYVTLFVFLWFGGEIIGAIVGLVVSVAQNPNALGNDPFPIFAYLFALGGAAIGGTVGYLIAHSLPAIEDPRSDRFADYDDDEEYGERAERRRRGNRRDDGSYEEAPGG